jgi:hypothetical protein
VIEVQAGLFKRAMMYLAEWLTASWCCHQYGGVHQNISQGMARRKQDPIANLMPRLMLWCTAHASMRSQRTLWVAS